MYVYVFVWWVVVNKRFSSLGGKFLPCRKAHAYSGRVQISGKPHMVCAAAMTLAHALHQITLWLCDQIVYQIFHFARSSFFWCPTLFARQDYQSKTPNTASSLLCHLLPSRCIRFFFSLCFLALFCFASMVTWRAVGAGSSIGAALPSDVTTIRNHKVERSIQLSGEGWEVHSKEGAVARKTQLIIASAFFSTLDIPDVDVQPQLSCQV